MKRLWILVLTLAALLIPVRVQAAETGVFDEQIAQLEEQVPEQAGEGLSELELDSVDDVIARGVDSVAILSYIGRLLSDNMASPFSVFLLLAAVIILSAIGESYTYSLRYTDTKEIMSAAAALYVATVTVQPMSKLLCDIVDVIGAVSKLMQGYAALGAGMLVFSGRAISSSGYYASVIGVSQLLTWLSSTILLPLLQLFLSLSISSGICSRLKLNGIIEAVGNGMKWMLSFLMTIFTAVIGLNGALTAAGDTVAGRAAKFTLSSFIPLVGSSVAEAYQTVRGSVDLLRSGVGVFVILSVFAAFAPLLIRALLWSLAIGAAKITQEAFSVSSTAPILNALLSVVKLLRAVTVAVITAFLISTAVMFRMGGAL